MPIDESAIAGQKIGTLARYAAVRMPSCRSPSRGARRAVEELARRVRPPLERQHERRDPLVVVDELLFARVGVVDAVDPFVLQRRVVFARRADVVPAAARLVQIVVEVRAGRDQAVDVAVLEQVRDDQPHAAGAQRAGHAQEDRAVAAEHLFPDAPRGREVAPWNEIRSIRASSSSAADRLDDERFDRHAQKAGFLRHAGADSIVRTRGRCGAKNATAHPIRRRDVVAKRRQPTVSGNEKPTTTSADSSAPNDAPIVACLDCRPTRAGVAEQRAVNGADEERARADSTFDPPSGTR